LAQSSRKRRGVATRRYPSHTPLPETVRKAEVDEESKETRLQGLKDQLAATDEDTEELQEEIEELEQRIEDLTSFDSASSFHTKSGGEP
jgi:predicted  nucleic acid-binding Zn-ribbon protein